MEVLVCNAKNPEIYFLGNEKPLKMFKQGRKDVFFNTVVWTIDVINTRDQAGKLRRIVLKQSR